MNACGEIKSSNRVYTYVLLVAKNVLQHVSAAGQTHNDYESPLLDSLDSDLAEGLSECFIERERLQLGRLITSGNFGEIRKGKLRMRDQTIVNVAVKSLKSKQYVKKVLTM